MEKLVKTLHGIKNASVMVVGDIMLDTFVYGDVDRISPESPVPVLTVRSEDKMLGGAGNVFSNLCALGATPRLFCIVGDDPAAKEIRAMVAAKNVSADGVVTDTGRPTILKTRYLARHQQLMRTDVERIQPLDDKTAQALLASVQKTMMEVGAVVLSDYGKGVLTKSLIAGVIDAAKKNGVPVFVDPKGSDFSIYRGAYAITPNRKELALAVGAGDVKSDADIVAAAKKIMDGCGIENVIATRSEDGMSVLRTGHDPVHISTQAREVFDVSGAGDTVIATLAAGIAAGADLVDAARLSNIAAGIAVSKVGTTPVRADEILRTLEDGDEKSFGISPLLDDVGAKEKIQKWKASGFKVGLTNGCFDILHAGHVRYLNEARRLCDRLIVALNRDASVRLLKGSSRPVNDEVARATVLGGLGCVDGVVFFGATKAGEDNTPCALIGKIQPDIYFKGGDYKKEQLPETKIVESYGGTVAIMSMFDGFSTTSIIERSRKSG